MIKTVILLCIFGIAEVCCIVGLIVIYFREKKMKRNPDITALLVTGWVEEGVG